MSQPSSIDNRELKIDRFGALASGLCAIHCVLGALLPALLGSLGLGVLFGGKAEWFMTCVAIAFALATLALGWRHHRSKLVLCLIGLGIVGLLGSRVIEMGAHHEEVHERAVERGAEGDAHTEAHHEEAHHEEAHHDDPMHALGTVLGVCAGLLLVGGHLVNLRLVKRCREQGCES